ncbi:PTS sugar transporter subunit IIA [Olsenella sp. HMSC062G07]|uniref:PTS sugar transporter subunit IIA n=1 Tax=Olsenella sp. HMSC062G07 TaxID=1739330 RepID=UPI00143C08E0|nr:PTS sugar transporter subunit IIA [Olsenella sp. HMSC062G07]
MGTPYILLMTHGHAGEALISSSEMIVGHEEKLSALSLDPGASVESLAKKASHLLEIVGGPALVLVDVFGGTPANVAMMLSKSHEVRCVSGLNLGMLLEVLMMRGSSDDLSLRDLQRIAQSAGSAACRSFTYDDYEGR